MTISLLIRVVDLSMRFVAAEKIMKLFFFNRKILVCIGIALLVFLVWYLSTLQTRQVKSVIRGIQQSIRDEKIDGVMSGFSTQYLDSYGYRLEEVQDILLRAFASMEDINVIILKMDIQREKDEAEVGIDFRVVATVELGFRGYVIGNMKQPAQITVYFKRIEKQWRITGIDTIRNPY